MIESIIVGFDKPFGTAIKSIRKAVFTEEQSVPENLDFEGKDPEAVHVLVSDNGRYVGTGRVLPDGHIGRVAVLKDYRGLGCGKHIIQALTKVASHRDLKRVFLGAQLHAVHFYEKLGFSAYGDPYLDAGIKHLHMEKMISNANRTEQS